MSNPTSRKLHAVTEIATAVVEPFRFINFAGAHALPGDAIQGVSEKGAAVGEAFSVVTVYSALVLAAAAIAAGTAVGPDADGTGMAVPGGPFVALGDAAAGELIEVRVAAPAVPSRAGNSIIFYGDSHQQKGQASNSSSTVKYEFFYADCFPWWMQALSGARFNILGWRAVGGKTTTEILGWIQRVIEANPGVVVLNGGTNDALVEGLTDVAVPIANIESIWRQLTARGIIVITVTPIITDPTVGGLSATEGMMLRNLRHLMIERAAKYPGVVLIDAYALGVNPSSGTGAQKTNYLRTDKVHTSNIYSYKIAKTIVAAINGLIPPKNNLIASAADVKSVDASSLNFMTNPLFTTTSGGTASTGASGTVHSGWTVSRASGAAGSTVAVSNAARADGFGNDMVLTLTGDAAETSALLKAEYSISLTGIVAGESYYAKCEITVGASPAVLRGVQLMLKSDSVSPTSTYIATAGHSDDMTGNSMYPLEEGYTATYETPACIAQPGVTAGNFIVRVSCYVGAAASAVVKIGRISLHKVDGYPSPTVKGSA